MSNVFFIIHYPGFYRLQIQIPLGVVVFLANEKSLVWPWAVW